MKKSGTYTVIVQGHYKTWMSVEADSKAEALRTIAAGGGKVVGGPKFIPMAPSSWGVITPEEQRRRSSEG